MTYAVIISGDDNFLLLWDGNEATVTRYHVTTLENLGLYSTGEKSELRKNGVNIEKDFLAAGGNALITKYSRYKANEVLNNLENRL